MDTKDPRRDAADAIARIEAKAREKLLKRARKHGLTDQEMNAVAEARIRKKLLKHPHKYGLIDKEAIALGETRIAEKLSERARKYGMSDQEVAELSEEWKRAAKRTKYLRLPSRVRSPANSDRSVGR
jgi:type III secretion system FlhB-like substrate exporter